MTERGSEQTRYVQAAMAVATQEYGLFINGESAEPASGELRELTEPASGAPLARVAMANEQDVDRAVEAARAALEGPWGKTPPNERSRLLHALADLVHEHRKELAELEAVNVVPGEGPTTGAFLVAHPGVDKVAFTGSTRSGSEVMRLASSPVKRISLELGGKSPNIVFADADLDDALPSSAWSIYYSAGQSCEARSRVLVERPLYDDFVSRFVELARKIKVGDPLDAETQMGSLISTAHRDKVHAFVEEAVEEGAEVVAGGKAGEQAFY